MRRTELILPFLPDSELAAVRAIESLGGRIGLTPDEIDEISHSAVEACINAREHSGSRDGLMRIGIAANQAGIRVRVSDRGRGFDPARVARPSSGRRGRGLAIIAALMDEVRVESGPRGTCIDITRHRRRSAS